MFFLLTSNKSIRQNTNYATGEDLLNKVDIILGNNLNNPQELNNSHIFSNTNFPENENELEN